MEIVFYLTSIIKCYHSLETGLSLKEMDSTTRVQILNEVVCIPYHA